MIKNNPKLLHVVKRLALLLLFVIVLLSLAFGIGWRVLRSDHAYVIKRIQETALEKWNADLKLEGYELEWVKPYPLIRFELRGLSFGRVDKPDYPVLKITNAVSEFNPWDLVTGDFNAHPLHLDSVWIHLHKDSLNNSNMAFKRSDAALDSISNEKYSDSGFDIELDELPSIEINYLDFHLQNDYKQKWHWAKLRKAHIRPVRSKNREWSAHLQSDCFFEGLVFNENDGGFLMDTDGKLDLNISLTNRGKTLKVKNSFLQVNKDKYLLEGQYDRGEVERIKLQINSDGVIMSDVLPLLSTKINKALEDIQIDQPIRAQFSLDNPLIPGQKGAMHVEFATDSACVNFRAINMSSATLVGTFSNDCDEDGIGDAITSCITIQQLDGDLFDLIPAELHGQFDNLKYPTVQAFGKLAMDLPRLNPELAYKGKVTFLDGRAQVNFEYAGLLEDILKAPFDEEKIHMQGDANFEQVRLNLNNRTEPMPSLSGHMTFDDKATMLEDLSLHWLGSDIKLTGQLSNLPEFLWYADQSLNSDLCLHFDLLDLNKLSKSKSASSKNQNAQKSPVSKPKDYKYLDDMARRIASNINGHIQLEIDRLIYDTLYFTDVNTRFHLFSPLRAEFVDSSMIHMDQLSAKFMGTEALYVDFTFPQTSAKEVVLDIHLPSAVRFANTFLNKKLNITKGSASLQLMTHVPLYALLEPNRLLPNLRFQGLIDFDQIELKASAFSWPVRRLSGSLILDNDQIVLNGLKFQYEGSPFRLDGKIEDYAFFRADVDRKAVVDLRMRGSHLDFRNNEARKAKDAPQSSQTKTNKKKPSLTPPELFRSLDTLFYYTTGKLDLRLDSILTARHVIQPFVVQAQLLPDKYNSKNHMVLLDSFNFGFGPQNNIRGSATLTNPDAPQVDAHFQARMKLVQLGELLPSEYLKMQDGYFKMDLHYQSPLYENINAKNYLLDAIIDGNAEMVNGKLFYNYRGFIFNNIYGHFHFDQRALYIRDLDLKINGNRLIASGQSTDFFPFFVLPDRRAHIDLNVASPHFDFGGFTAPHGLGKDTIKAIGQAPVPLSLDTTQSVLSKTGGFIDNLLDKGSIEMSTDFKEIVYDEFLAANVKGNISLQPDTVQLKNLRMDLAKGTFAINGSISDVVLHQPKMKLDVQLEQNDVREIFRQFEDFGQEHLGYENLEGKASADINFSADINSNYSVLPETMHGDMRVKLSGGQLIEVGALKKVTGFLFRKRRLNHILIDTLETVAHIRGSDLYINKFYLHSSSFDFGVEGIYSLGVENNTRILFAVPISNLFRRHLTQKELESGNSKRKGMRVFIEARPKKDRMRFFLKIPVFGRKKYRLNEGED